MTTEEKMQRDLDKCDERIEFFRAEIVTIATAINLDTYELDYAASRLAWWINQRMDIATDIRKLWADAA
jgi:hypothetical protein